MLIWFHRNSKNPSENYDDAVGYVDSRREIIPGIYNENRLGEKPLPDTESEIDESTSQDDQISQPTDSSSVEASLNETETVENGLENAADIENSGAAGLVKDDVVDDIDLDLSDMDISPLIISTNHAQNTTVSFNDDAIDATDMSLEISATKHHR